MDSWKDVRTEVENILSYCQDKGGAGGSGMIGLNERGVIWNWEVIVHKEQFFTGLAPGNETEIDGAAVA